jgi:hypothetical protein
LTPLYRSERLARVRSLLVAVALVAGFLPGLARAAEDAAPPRIYRWIDENGIAHYTTDPERIPKSLRRRYGLPAEPLRNEPLAARAPAAAPEPSTGPEAWAAQEKSVEPATPAAVNAAPPEWSEGETADVAAAAPAAARSGERLEALELRIAELSAAIAADEDALSGWIADPANADVVALADQPDVRAVAERLPKRIQELEALRRERDALQP